MDDSQVIIDNLYSRVFYRICERYGIESEQAIQARNVLLDKDAKLNRLCAILRGEYE